MKKLLILLLALGVSSSLFAQAQSELDRIWKKRSGYFNIGYVSQELSFVDMPDAKFSSKWGVSLSSGKTFYLHKKPIGGVLKFGLDWTWFDLNVANYDCASRFDGEYDPDYDYEDESDMPAFLRDKMYQAEIGMQFGPSITVNPVDHLKITAYFRVTPSYSGIYYDEEFFGSYATVLNPGVSVAWKLLSVGFEYRTGKANYKNFMLEESEEDISFVSGDKVKMETGGFRIYFGFRF